jgi:uncharacterized protein YdhG (YjbR/CyaY superfamily)
MAAKKQRSDYFPLIEKRYGEKMSYWFAVMEKLAGKKYPEQVNHLKENYGFSQAHANALVMYSRGSKSASRFDKPTDWYKTVSKQQAATVKKIFKAITTKHKSLELVVAWNQPMLKKGDQYVFGVSATKGYLLIAPWSGKALKKLAPRLKEYKVNKKTIQVPSDWQVDAKLLQDLVKESIAEGKKS